MQKASILAVQTFSYGTHESQCLVYWQQNVTFGKLYLLDVSFEGPLGYYISLNTIPSLCF